MQGQHILLHSLKQHPVRQKDQPAMDLMTELVTIAFTVPVPVPHMPQPNMDHGTSTLTNHS